LSEEPRPRFSVHSRLRSFTFAFAGLRHFAASEHNAWIHTAATIAVLALAAYLRVGRDDWLWLLLAIGWVWMAEAFNTAIERLADVVSGERRDDIKVVKDLGAAGVLISAAGALIIGIVVLWPHIEPILR
jgi:diacylglycerol kinase (ATP)